MSLFSKLFGGGAGAKSSGPTPVEYAGFNIFPEPVSGPGGFRIGARIEKTEDGETKSHLMIRADVINSEKDAIDASVNKAKQMIDQQGDAIFP